MLFGLLLNSQQFFASSLQDNRVAARVQTLREEQQRLRVEQQRAVLENQRIIYTQAGINLEELASLRIVLQENNITKASQLVPPGSLFWYTLLQKLPPQIEAAGGPILLHEGLSAELVRVFSKVEKEDTCWCPRTYRVYDENSELSAVFDRVQTGFRGNSSKA